MSLEMSRRQFSAAIAAALSTGIAMPSRLWSLTQNNSAIFDWTSLNPALHVAIGAGGNSLVVKGPDASAIIDTKFLGMGPFMAEQAASVAGTTLDYVFNTHHHGDHSGGNNAFGGAPVIAQQNAPDRVVATIAQGITGISDDPEGWLNQNVAFWEIELDDNERAEVMEFAAAVATLDPDAFAPGETFERRLQHMDTGIELRWRHVGPGHTDNDAFLFIPEYNVLHAGDLLFFGRHPFMRASDGGNTVGWQRSLAAAIATCDDETIVIPGHGPITNKTGLRAQSQYFDRLREIVIQQMGEGRVREDIVEFRPGEFRDLIWGDILPGLLGIIFDELDS